MTRSCPDCLPTLLPLRKQSPDQICVFASPRHSIPNTCGRQKAFCIESNLPRSEDTKGHSIIYAEYVLYVCFWGNPTTARADAEYFPPAVSGGPARGSASAPALTLFVFVIMFLLLWFLICCIMLFVLFLCFCYVCCCFGFLFGFLCVASFVAPHFHHFCYYCVFPICFVSPTLTCWGLRKGLLRKGRLDHRIGKVCDVSCFLLFSFYTVVLSFDMFDLYV